MTVRLASLAPALLFCIPSAVGQDTGGSAFQEVVRGAKAARGRYLDNKRLLCTAKQYDVKLDGGVPSVTPEDDWDLEIVRDAAGNMRTTVTASRLKPERVGEGYYATPDTYYLVVNEDRQYSVVNFLARARNPSAFLARSTAGLAWVPFSFDGERSVEAFAEMLKDHSRMAFTPSIKSVGRVSRNGRGVVAVVSQLVPRAGLTAQLRAAGDATEPIKQTSYFDADNGYVFLGCEAAYPPTGRYPQRNTRTFAVEYRSGGKFPIPARYTEHVRFPGGEPVQVYEAVYTAFEDYTPTADDFKLEGRYGLTTPAGPDYQPEPRPAGGGPRWWVWAVVLLATLGAGFVGYRYYRRRRSTAA